MDDAPEVTRGQIWRDGAVQAIPRWVLVVDVSAETGMALCMSSSKDGIVKISLDRFNNDIHGYFFECDVWHLVEKEL